MLPKARAAPKARQTRQAHCRLHWQAARRAPRQECRMVHQTRATGHFRRRLMRRSRRGQTRSRRRQAHRCLPRRRTIHHRRHHSDCGRTWTRRRRSTPRPRNPRSCPCRPRTGRRRRPTRTSGRARGRRATQSLPSWPPDPRRGGPGRTRPRHRSHCTRRRPHRHNVDVATTKEPMDARAASDHKFSSALLMANFKSSVPMSMRHVRNLPVWDNGNSSSSR